MSLFICPICKASLHRQEQAYRCPNGHCYDVAKEGYTYLLPVNQRNSLNPGDDKAMAAARQVFLSNGYYAPLKDALCGLLQAQNPSTLLDAGCGEGYYTQGMRQALPEAKIAAIDISKFCMKKAAKREKTVEFAVSSSYHLPLADGTVEAVVNCFSPLALEEFSRVLTQDGMLYYVVPGAAHLWELKEVLYDKPYPNEEKETPYQGFAYENIIPLDFTMELTCQAHIQALFAMTPYCWKTPKSGMDRLAEKQQLTVRASFKIHVFRKESPVCPIISE